MKLALRGCLVVIATRSGFSRAQTCAPLQAVPLRFLQ